MDRPAGVPDSAPPADELLLPAGTRLVHIGPPKTGTTTVQRAFHACRAAISKQGVHYIGPTPQPVAPVHAVTGRSNPMTGKPPPMRYWHYLVAEVRRAGQDRTIISSEFFADARSDSIPRIIDDLDPARVHVVVTLRPLTAILPSQWQQFVQSGMRSSFDGWLETMLSPATLSPAEGAKEPTFWHRHRHDRLIARWADVVGADRMTVVVLDETDPTSILRTFEQLTGLRRETLVAERDLANRSMTLAEVETVRAFNDLLHQEGLGTPLQAKVMRYGAGPYMKLREPGPDEERVRLPSWAADRAVEIADAMVAAIGATGVRVVGNLADLARPAKAVAPGDRSARPSITPEIAATAAIGVLLASGAARGGAARIPATVDGPEEPVHDPNPYVPRPTIEPLALVRLSTVQILAVLARRGRSALARRIPIVGPRIG